jgi:hypothetical protein
MTDMTLVICASEGSGGLTRADTLMYLGSGTASDLAAEVSVGDSSRGVADGDLCRKKFFFSVVAFKRVGDLAEVSVYLEEYCRCSFVWEASLPD